MDQSELKWLDPTMKPVLPIIRRVFMQYAPGGHVEFTAGKEWFNHCMFSLHHSGNAVDVRTRTLPDGGIGSISAHIAKALQEALNSILGVASIRFCATTRDLQSRIFMSSTTEVDGGANLGILRNPVDLGLLERRPWHGAT